MIYVWREIFWGRPMNRNEADPDLRIKPKYVLPSAAMAVVSVVIFFAAGPIFAVTNRAAEDLIDTTEYVSTVFDANQSDELVGGPGPIGQVLDPGPSGLAHVPGADEPQGVSEVADGDADAADNATTDNADDQEGAR